MAEEFSLFDWERVHNNNIYFNQEQDKYEAGDYTLSELIKVYSHWVSF